MQSSACGGSSHSRERLRLALTRCARGLLSDLRLRLAAPRSCGAGLQALLRHILCGHAKTCWLHAVMNLHARCIVRAASFVVVR